MKNKTTENISRNKIGENLLTEAYMLQQFQHQNIVKFIGVSFLRKPFYLITEFIDETLETFLKRESTLNIEQKLKISKDCSEALAYLEKNRVLHL